MQWFWEQYTADSAQRAEITASPLRATLDDLIGLPPALVINGEADVLRDEGEAYAAKLRAAPVPVTSVRHNGTIHDFVMQNALRRQRHGQGRHRPGRRVPARRPLGLATAGRSRNSVLGVSAVPDLSS